jgi:hypothetical protein
MKSMQLPPFFLRWILLFTAPVAGHVPIEPVIQDTGYNVEFKTAKRDRCDPKKAGQFGAPFDGSRRTAAGSAAGDQKYDNLLTISY